MKKIMNHSEYKRALKGKTDDELRFTMNDAMAAANANPTGDNVDYYLDEVCYCADELFERRQKQNKGEVISIRIM